MAATTCLSLSLFSFSSRMTACSVPSIQNMRLPIVVLFLCVVLGVLLDTGFWLFLCLEAYVLLLSGQLLLQHFDNGFCVTK